MSEDRKYKKLLSNTAIVGMGTLGSKVLVYLLVRLYTAVLTESDFSIASNITEMATLLIPVISLGIGEAVFRFGMDKKYRQSEIFTSGFVAAAIGCVLLPAIIAILANISYFDGYIWLISLYILSSVFHTLCSQFIRAREQFKLYAVQGILNTLLTIGFNILFLIPLKMGVVGYVLSVVVADFCTTLFIIALAKLWREIDFRSVNRATLKAMLVYSIPLIPTTISWWITNVSDRYMVTYIQGDFVNGLYSAAYKIPTLLMVVMGIFNNAWKYSAVNEKGSKEEAVFFSNVYEMFMTVVFLTSAALIAFSKVLSYIMFAPSYRSAWIYIPITTVAMVFSAFASFTGTVFIVEKKSNYSFYTAAAGAVVNIVLNLLLIPLFNEPQTAAMGAAIATLISYIVMYAMRAFFSRKLLKYNLQLGKLLNNCAVITVMVLTMTFEISYWILIQALCIVLLLIINCKTILRMLKKVIPQR